MHPRVQLISNNLGTEIMCIYDIDNIYALQIENTSERDSCSLEATKAVAKKAFLATALVASQL